MAKPLFLCLMVCLVSWTGVELTPAAAPTVPTPKPSADAQQQVFEKHTRPILVTHCLECHGPSKQEGDVRLDTRSAILSEGEGGPIVVPGKVDQSRLLVVIQHHEDDVQMPPEEKLSDAQIAALSRWVRIGAPWPKSVQLTAPAGASLPDLDKTLKTHWALQPVRAPQLPKVGDDVRINTPVDRFVAARLESQGLSPSPPADRATLIRRLSIDLTGLPPTMAEMHDFVNDSTPDAYERLVDRLLASPHYGERWGRFWLDVARYGDNRGYVFTQETRYAYSYTYRDYVIRAFNEDVPFDQFILEQLAADRLDRQGDDRSLAALGFLTTGSRFRNGIHDIIDDRIDVVTRGLQGLTVTCARCHDHKSDPITMTDYYALYGVFSSSYEPKDLPQIGQSPDAEGYKAYQAELGKREQARETFLDSIYGKLMTEMRVQAGPALALAAGKNGARKQPQTKEGPRPQVVRMWQTYLVSLAGKPHPIFGPLLGFVRLPKDRFAQEARTGIQKLQQANETADEANRINPLVLDVLAKTPPKSLVEAAQTYGTLLAGIEKQWQETLKASPQAKGLDEPAAEAIRQLLYSEQLSAGVPREQIARFLRRDERNKLSALQRKVDQWKTVSPHAPPRAMVLLDSDKPRDARLFQRGNPARPGDVVPRRFLTMLEGPDSVYRDGSGRLELAKSIVDRSNPLTARVFVNRVWMHHFGTPLVVATSNFGVQTDPPTHPELLDYLAHRFMEEGWSVKKLHKQIVLSATYQQSSAGREDCRKVDPENRLIWRMNRRRLDFEAMRDSLLAVSGELHRTLGGKPGDLLKGPGMRRRTVYGYVDRFNLPGLFRVFDFPNPDVSTGTRSETTVPQQALFGMNSPFVVERAKQVARLEPIAKATQADAKVRGLYRQVHAREPRDDEIALAIQFVAAADASTKAGKPGGQSLSGWEQLAQVLLMTNEFMFVD